MRDRGAASAEAWGRGAGGAAERPSPLPVPAAPQPAACSLMGLKMCQETPPRPRTPSRWTPALLALLALGGAGLCHASSQPGYHARPSARNK